MIEIILATGLGVVAYLLTEDGICDAKKCKGFFLPPSTSREKGHAMIGVLLAFLVVFRSQIAWGMYMEGRNAVGRVVAMSRCLALELLASLAHACVEEGISEKQSLGVSRSGRPRVVVRRGGVTLPELNRSTSRTKKVTSNSRSSRSSACGYSSCTIGRRSSMCARATARRRGRPRRRW